MVTHCDVDFRAGQRIETRGKPGRAGVVLLFVVRMLFVAVVGIDGVFSFLFFLGLRGEDMMAVRISNGESGCNPTGRVAPTRETVKLSLARLNQPGKRGVGLPFPSSIGDSYDLLFSDWMRNHWVFLQRLIQT